MSLIKIQTFHDTHSLPPTQVLWWFPWAAPSSTHVLWRLPHLRWTLLSEREAGGKMRLKLAIQRREIY